MNHSLFARDALPVLVEGGELFTSYKNNFLYEVNRKHINNIHITHNNKYIISNTDGIIHIWDIKSKKLVKYFNFYFNSINFLTHNLGGAGRRIMISKNPLLITSNDKYLIINSKDGLGLNFFDIENGKLIKEIKNFKEERSSTIFIEITSDGKKIIIGEIFGYGDDSFSKIRILDIKIGKIIETLSFDNMLSFLTTDGKNIIFSISNKNAKRSEIKIWDIKNKKYINTIPKKGLILKILPSFDKKSIFVSSILDKKKGFGIVEQLDISDGHIIKKLHKDTFAPIISMILDESNNSIIIDTFDNIEYIDINSGKIVKKIEKEFKDISVSLVLDNKQQLWGTSSKGGIFLRDKNGQLINEFIGRNDGNWIVFDHLNHKFYRGDNGNLFLKKNYPTSYDMEKKDDLQITIKSSKISFENGKKSDLNITIQNNGQTTYWIQAKTKDKYIKIKANSIDKIKHNEQITLNLECNVSLENLNPMPLENYELNITFTTANKSEYNLIVPISIHSAIITIENVEFDKYENNLKIKFKNIGNSDLSLASVKLEEPFSGDIQFISNLEINDSRTIFFELPKNFFFENNMSAKLIVFEDKKNRFSKIYIDNEYYRYISELAKERGSIQENVSFSKYFEMLPSHSEVLLDFLDENNIHSSVWKFQGVKITLTQISWYIYALWIFGALAFIGSAIYLRRYKNPTVTKLAKEPKALLTLSESQLKQAKQKLETIDRLESTLKEAEVTQEQFEKTLKFYESQEEEKAQLFAQQIEAKECKKEGNFYRIKMSEDFRLDALKSFLLYISDESSSKIEKEVTALNDKVFVLANEEQQNTVAKLAHDKTNRVIAPKVEELTELMLSSESQDVFVKILSNCLLAKDVSPYQLKGELKSESKFFGRVEILREIISNDEVNYLIVGARQLGKSSILKALERRYVKSINVDCYYIALEDKELLPSIAECLGLEKSVNLEQIVQVIKSHKKRPIFLIDEADKFIKHEKECDYRITSVFRKLSQEGNATFLLAGFWTLYEYVTLDYQSPLKNFGKLITLKGLDVNACRELMVEPMKRIGITYESESLVEETIKRCGYRANYIATVCDVALNKLKDGLIIGKKEIEEAVDDQDISNMLEGWGALSSDKEANRLDRLIVYLTIEKESFRLGNVVEGLEKYGLNIDIERVNESLDRLVLGYVLGKHKGNYSYQIPLLKERILEDDLDYLIDGEVNGLKSK